jgi:hypothetical protein
MPVILERIIWRRSKNIWGYFLRTGTKISDAKFVRCYLELFVGGGSYENARENKSVGFVSGARQCHAGVTSIRWAQLRITLFFCERRMARESPKCSIQRLIVIIWTRPEPEHCLCYQAQARLSGRADLYHTWREVEVLLRSANCIRGNLRYYDNFTKCRG